MVRLLSRWRGKPAAEAPLKAVDLGWLAIIVLFGGVAGPLLLMLGLVGTPASTAALLLNLEGLATLAIAWLVYRENVDLRAALRSDDPQVNLAAARDTGMRIKPERHHFRIGAGEAPALARHMSMTGG